jgi:hypothetical protein|tara:strand:- start:63 stop:1004 length:942 start_codon:yes stop_codon:yes gene_type:complete
MITYSALEASVKLNISKRAVQKRCKKDNIRKKDNKYSITDLVINKWAKEIKSNVPTNVPTNEPYNGTQETFIRGLENQVKDLKAEGSLINGKQEKRIKELEEKLKTYDALLEKYEEELEELDTARVEIKELKYQLDDFDPEAELKDYLPEIEGVPLEQIEAFEFNFKRFGEDEVKKGNLLFIQKDMISIEYTPEEFNNVKLNLENYKLLELKIKHLDELHTANLEKAVQAEKNKDKLHASEVKNKDEVHAVELLKAKESETHYKNIYYYTRKQNSDFTRMHEKVIEVVMLSGKENMIKTVKDAKNTDWNKSNN